ncbi:uncharacterized protein LOC130623612 [Hydractinia symbiolongicarpus]|uniref:uncharacterized protein LOC130623612 n=1 Tax=Hydractinia symbiolongicarpus TaxID=13093 RepID=UPI00254ECAD2|nr:uncharacterized protein LOC130623612 [Hydractinia symbiolongicarpus]
MYVSIFLFLFGAADNYFLYEKKIFTFVNGTTNSSTPFKVISSINEYNTEGSKRDRRIKRLLRKQDSLKIPGNFNYPSKTPPANKSGQTFKASFNDGRITYVEVLDEFNFDGNKATPVHISTSWYRHNQVESINHTPGKLTEAVENGNILNVTMSLEWKQLSQNESNLLNEDKEWEIDEYLCYYEGTSAKLNPFGKCVIPYVDIIEHFLRLWKEHAIPEATNGQRCLATNNINRVLGHPCGVIRERHIKQVCKNDTWHKIKYIHPIDQFLPVGEKEWYQFDTKPTALGITSNISYGFNRFKNAYDINFTVLFSNWTFDFPKGFLYNYRDQSFVKEKNKLDIFYWTEDEAEKSERTIPPSFFIMAYIMIGPATVLVLSLVLRLLTCSKHAFNLKVWQFKNKNIDMEAASSSFKKESQRIAKEEHEERVREALKDEGYDIEQV